MKFRITENYSSKNEYLIEAVDEEEAMARFEEGGYLTELTYIQQDRWDVDEEIEQLTDQEWDTEVRRQKQHEERESVLDNRDV